jgi:2',3'-cyclic-nucleotide 2'-phosphodiesterase (5'-nucleotidase family)
LYAALAIAAISTAGLTPATTLAGDGKVTLIHTGDIHGHLVPRPNVRSDGTGKLEGGLARMYTVVDKIRRDSTDRKGVNRSLLINTGDSVQGSGEALFTQGQAMIDVLNLFGFDAHAPGNWDFLYGADRFRQTFVGTNGNPPLANWNALSANLYSTTAFDDTAVCGLKAADPAMGGLVRPRARILPAYMIKQVGNVKVGILGMTTARAIAAIGPKVTAGFMFNDGNVEVPCFVDVLRITEKVDLVVMISELEMSRDIKLMETYPGVDVVLNSDMHEKTVKPIVIPHANGTSTLILEEGQDGTMVGKLDLNVVDGAVSSWAFKPIIVTSEIDSNHKVAAKIYEVRKPFVKKTFVAGQQVTVGGNTTTLLRPIDEIIAYTKVNLHRSNFVNQDMPGVVEGSSHDLLADAMRWAGGVQSASIRGFRYGTHVPAGWPIRMNDIYHYIPIAAKLGLTDKACGADLKFALENSTAGVFHPDPTQWQGGWMFAYSNMTFDLDACNGFMGATPVPVGGPTVANPTAPWGTARATNFKIGGNPVDDMDIYLPTTQACSSGVPGYTVAGYWFAEDPVTINNCNPCRGRLVKVMQNDGTPVDVAGPGITPPVLVSTDLLDITEAVVNYLRAPAKRGGIGGTVTASNLPIHRITVQRLPTINPYPFNVIQPLKGASAATCPAL